MPLTGIPDTTAVALLRNVQRKIANSTRADLLLPGLRPARPRLDRSAGSRLVCEFGLATVSEGVIGGSQQFGQRPSAGGDAGAGELVEQRRR